ncbi:MAG TPA: ribonuclease HII [Acidimicrobiales bacterium]
MLSAERDFFTFERPLWQRGAVVAGLDEVGRGALAGPLMVGAVLLYEERDVPPGLDDSKRLRPRQREQLVPLITAWCDDYAVGAASAREVDEFGLTAALRVAATRALEKLRVPPTEILLDGAIDFLWPASLLEPVADASSEYRRARARVTTIVRGDSRSALIAAASVIAKVERDAVMRTLGGAEDRYGWVSNKGYGSQQHLTALRRHGVSNHHRVTWRLPEKSSDS